MKELQIGETGVINGKKVRCVENGTIKRCRECAYDRVNCIFIMCLPHERKDKTSVIYKLIEKETK